MAIGLRAVSLVTSTAVLMTLYCDARLRSPGSSWTLITSSGSLPRSCSAQWRSIFDGESVPPDSPVCGAPTGMRENWPETRRQLRRTDSIYSFSVMTVYIECHLYDELLLCRAVKRELQSILCMRDKVSPMTMSSSAHCNAT